MRRFRLVAAAILIAFLASPALADGEVASDFSCKLCRDMLIELREASSASTWKDFKSLVNQTQYCKAANFGGFNPCDVVLPQLAKMPVDADSSAFKHGSREACVQLDLCEVDQLLGMPRHRQPKAKSGWAKVPSFVPLHADTPVHDMKIGLAHGSRGYDYVRISYVDNEARNHSAGFMDFFTYNKPFNYVWDQKWLHTTVVPISNETNSTTFSIGDDYNVTISLPKKNKGVRGFLVADPCFNGDYVGCREGAKYQVFDRLTQLLNVGLTKDVDTWVIIGDNFYDPHGVLVPQFMQALTVEAKSKPVISCPGNHDFWQHGLPHSKKGGYDTYGNGYMQYWGTDTQAAVNQEKAGNSTPFDFSVNPSTEVIAKAENFFTYNMIGNLATITFSGAHTKDIMDPMFEEACRWVADVQPAYVFVIGHWSSEKLGCAPDMRTEDVHGRIQKMEGCKAIADRIKWFEGHQHCNWIVKAKEGFRVAGWGMGGCGNFGVPYFDITDDGHLTIGYFPVVGGNGTLAPAHEGPASPENVEWDVVISCLQAHGLKGCMNLGLQWHDQSLK